MRFVFIFTSIALLSSILLVNVNIISGENEDNYENRTLMSLPSKCYNRFKVPFKIVDITTLYIPKLDYKTDTNYAFVTYSDQGCLETGHFVVKKNTVLEMPYFLSYNGSSVCEIEIFIQSSKKNNTKVLVSTRPNRWNIFKTELPTFKRRYAIYKVSSDKTLTKLQITVGKVI